MNIYELRCRTNLSQAKFAEKFHLNLKTIQSWEQGIYETPEKFLFLISRILDLEEELDNYNKVDNK